MISDRGRPRTSSMKQKLIMCECGMEILLIPDVQEMDRAIFNHAEWHAGKKEKDPEKAKAVFEQIQNYLVKQVLEAASRETSPKRDGSASE